MLYVLCKFDMHVFAFYFIPPVVIHLPSRVVHITLYQYNNSNSQSHKHKHTNECQVFVLQRRMRMWMCARSIQMEWILLQFTFYSHWRWKERIKSLYSFFVFYYLFFLCVWLDSKLNNSLEFMRFLYVSLSYRLLSIQFDHFISLFLFIKFNKCCSLFGLAFEKATFGVSNSRGKVPNSLLIRYLWHISINCRKCVYSLLFFHFCYIKKEWTLSHCRLIGMLTTIQKWFFACEARKI